MMRVGIESDERYPDYFLTDPDETYSKTVEVDGRTLRRWRRIISEYDAVQTEMARVFKEGDTS